MKRITFLFACVAAVAAVSPLSAADPVDWTYWRGPEQNGISRETGLIDNWNHNGGEGSNVAWMRSDLGGRSTPVVMNGKLFTIVPSDFGVHRREAEKVVALDAATGKTVWENRYNVWLSDVPVERIGWTSVVADPETNTVFVLGACGFFQCINADTGKTVWSTSLHEQFGLLSTYGGRTNFPIVVDDLVIISAVFINWGDFARPAHRFLAMNKRTGEVAWFNGTTPLPPDTTYSSPVVKVIGGQKLMVFGSGDGRVWAFQPRTGKPVWSYSLSLRGLNVAPIVDGDTIYTGQSEENFLNNKTQGSIVSINGVGQGDITKTNTNWITTETILAGRASPLLIDDRLYYFDDSAKLFVVDAKTGKQIGQRIPLGTIMRASPLYADGKIYISELNGRWYILKPDKAKGATILAKGRLASGDEVHAAQIAWRGRIYFQSTSALYCLQDKSKTPGATELPAEAVEKPAAEDEKPALVQVVPNELMMKPGETQQYKVKLFNSRGQFLKESPAEFTLAGPGQVDDKGLFTAPSGPEHVATILTAKVGELTGKARVRIIPPLPWSFTFEGQKEPPLTWVGARYRHVIRPVEGNNVMVKITTIPLGTRSRAWFGPSELADYTIQADVKGFEVNAKKPDMGLLNQGYTLDLQGQSGRLEIRMWEAQRRIYETLPYVFKPGVWYTMKFQVSHEMVKGVDGKMVPGAVARGKVWERDQPEPAQWTLVAEDDMPQPSGSPGLFGNATNAEIFIDNVKVTKNE